MPEVSWNRFSMTNADPAVDDRNPVTRSLNMVQRSDGTCFKRKTFEGGTGGVVGVRNHITLEIDNVPYMLALVGTEVKVSKDGAGFETITMISSDAIWTATTHNTRRGSFAVHGEEAYFCDERTVFAWKGGTAARRPGIPSLAESDQGSFGLSYRYPDMPSLRPFGGPGEGNISDWHPSGSPSVHPTDLQVADPYIIPAQDKMDGEKTLNTAFCFSLYDPLRDIYGKRSESYALPFIFGPEDPDGSNTVLTEFRTQYAKVIRLPKPPPGYENLQVAIWFSLGQHVIANPTATTFQNLGWVTLFFLHEWYPAMSRRMTSTFFLEARVPWQRARHTATKDNATLFQSGRYIDVYDRPVPAKHMAILRDGTAIYFYPWRDDRAPGLFQNHAEYSIKHPEQVGRKTETQRETISPLPNLKGTPLATVSDGDTQLLLTRQAVYRIGFAGGHVQLVEISGGRGLRGRNVADASVGQIWMADEGVVWLRSGQMVLLDKRLGFGRWVDDLTTIEKFRVSVGVAEALQQIMVFLPDPDDGGFRALVYDFERDFISEFKEPGGVAYAAHFRTTNNAQLWAFGWGQYPGVGFTTQDTRIVFWLNEAIDRPKTLHDIVLHFPDFSGTVTLRITSFEHARQVSEDVDQDQEIHVHTQSVDIAVTGSGRHLIADFHGLRGRVFKFELIGPSGAWGIKRVQAYYDLDEAEDITLARTI